MGTPGSDPAIIHLRFGAWYKLGKGRISAAADYCERGKPAS